MNAARIVGLILIVAGIAALGMGGFSFTKETHQAKIGPDRAVGEGKAGRQLSELGRRGCDRGGRGAAGFRRQEGLIGFEFSFG